MGLEYSDIIHLKAEFEKLGFDIKDIDLEDTLTGRNHLFQMSLNSPITDPKIPADHFAVLFTGRAPGNGQAPSIDIIHAAFLNSTSTTLVERSYPDDSEPLPMKEKIFKDLSEGLQLKKVRDKIEIDKNNSEQRNLNEIRKRNKF